MRYHPSSDAFFSEMHFMVNPARVLYFLVDHLIFLSRHADKQHQRKAVKDPNYVQEGGNQLILIQERAASQINLFVGGSINQGSMPYQEKNKLFLPSKHSLQVHGMEQHKK